jgi:hypothetical protein
MADMGDPEIESAKKAIADDAGADRGNDVTGEAADDKTPATDGDRKGATPSRNSVLEANAAGADPDKG